MDKFREQSIQEYNSWDMNCKYVCPSQKFQTKLKKIFNKKSRAKLKQKLIKEIKNDNDNS